MDHFTSDIIQALVKKDDVTEIFRSHLETAVNTLLKTELTAFLDYEKYDRVGFNSGNSRNGVYSRTLHTEYGDLQIDIPRDRNGDFKQQTVAPYKRSNDTLESFVIHMFQKGVMMSEISHLIERMYGHHYTPQTISNMTQAVTEEVEAFRQRSLSERYVCVVPGCDIPARQTGDSDQRGCLYRCGHPGGWLQGSAGLYCRADGICACMERIDWRYPCTGRDGSPALHF